MPRIKDPDAPATTRQGFKLFKQTHVDVRPVGLTKQQASDLIQLANEDPALVREEMLQRGGTAKGDLPAVKNPDGDVTASSALAPAPGSTPLSDTVTPTAQRDTNAAPDEPPVAYEAVLRRLGADSVLVLPPAIATLLPTDSRFNLTLTPDGALLRLIRD